MTRLLNGADRLARGLARGLAWAAAGLLVAIVLITVADATLRYTIARPIRGSNEMIAILLSHLTVLALPWCAATGSQLTVDFISGKVRGLLDALLQVIVTAVALLTLWFLTARSWDKALEAWEWGDATILLHYPLWMLYGGIALGVGLYALVLALQALRPLAGGMR